MRRTRDETNGTDGTNGTVRLMAQGGASNRTNRTDTTRRMFWRWENDRGVTATRNSLSILTSSRQLKKDALAVLFI